MVRLSATRMLLLGALSLPAIALAFLIGARAGTTLVRTMALTGGQAPAALMAAPP
jgi:hypothetical protein